MNELLFCAIPLLLLGSKTRGQELPAVDRIVDGAPINITEVPYMLSYRANNEHACGAGIINREWGVTAAHCVFPFIDNPEFSITVRSGSSKYDTGGVIHNVTTLTYHENYDEGNNDYDIAVFKVHPPFEFNNATQPVKLPEDSETVDTNWGLIAGWGYFIDFDPVLSETLQYVIVPKMKREKCLADYKGKFEVTERQVCYGFSEGGKDSCKGDSGGPLVNKGIMIGITSWGPDCGGSHEPGVYTDVIGLAEWIKNKTM
ncbi:trypsin-7-like [Bombus flavifrons]|uniref:trypsin-7-like n=1 Tax=Bombus flavifrons TaxID=103934 RepID=UPI003703F19B